MNKLIIGILLVITGGLIGACNKKADNNMVQEPVFSHTEWNQMLAQHVDAAGDVDYLAFLDDTTKLKDYLDYLAENEPELTWSNNKKMAYWINLYNAFTIYNILIEYPVNSILDIDNGMIWTQRLVPVGDTSYTLDQIEKELLIGTYNEPKVHFAVNCAAASCPPLLNEAWTEMNIQQYYGTATTNFINDTSYNFLSRDSVDISQIFNWYTADFGGRNNLINYLQQYADSVISDSAVVTFRNYDWDLNVQ